MKVLILLLILYLPSLIRSILLPKRPLELNVYFGVPGSGKTTYAAYLASQCQKESIVIRLCRRFPSRLSSWILNSKYFRRAVPVWSNVPIKDTYEINAKTDIGVYMIEDGKLIIDEAGVEFNNRDYKSFPKPAIKFFKYHRHYGISVDVFSQSFEDMDVTLRRLAQNFFVVKKSIIPKFIVVKRIYRKIGIDDNTHQIIDKYYFGWLFFGRQLVYCPPLWKMFDSYNTDPLPQKDWSSWGGDSVPVTPQRPYNQRCRLRLLNLYLYSLRQIRAVFSKEKSTL